MFHTSGTTARPKIVPLTHTNICASAQNHRVTLELVEGDRCLNVMPLFHIHGLISVVLSSLIAGASVACAPGFYAPKFFEWMEALRPTWYTAAPTIHQAILACAASMRAIIERCPLRFIRSAAAALPPRTRKVGSVGAAAGPAVAIMGEAGHILPVGETGEIVIRGTNVIQAYENNPAANLSSFTDGWFRTGDQGLLDDDGYLFITGRLKELITRGGEKISPREIEEALMDHPAVAPVISFAVPHAQLGEDVAAAVVLRQGGSATEREMREFAARRLADFKVPSQVVFMDEIPKGPTSKFQRIGLAEKLGLTGSHPTDRARRQTSEGLVAPRSPVERELAQIWAEVLGLDQVGLHDSFLDLGGHSLSASQIVAKVYDRFRVEVSPGTLLATPTVAAIAAVILREQGAMATPEDQR